MRKIVIDNIEPVACIIQVHPCAKRVDNGTKGGTGLIKIAVTEKIGASDVNIFSFIIFKS
jgi:hypothetical protein